jgi:hypothetical protein
LAKELTLDKVGPHVVAQALGHALESGVEDVFPDPTAAQMFEAWKVDAKAIEVQMAQPADGSHSAG